MFPQDGNTVEVDVKHASYPGGRIARLSPRRFYTYRNTDVFASFVSLKSPRLRANPFVLTESLKSSRRI